MRQLSFLIFLFPLLAAIAGCATWRAQPPLRAATAEQLVELLREREAAIRTLKGLFRAQIKAPGLPIAQQVEGVVFYRRPDALRLQGFNRLGGELFEFVLGEDVYRLRLPTTGQVLTGRVTELDRIGQLGRPFQLSVWAVSGAVGIAPVSDQEKVLLSEDGDRYRMDVLKPGEPEGVPAGRPTRRLWFERRSFQVIREDRLTPAGEVEATMQLEDFRPVDFSPKGHSPSPMSREMADPMVKPFKISMRDGQGQGTLWLIFHEIVPNPSLKPEELEPRRS
ncbi:MAG: LolA family protein [Nitrospiraceae bacterium]